MFRHFLTKAAGVAALTLGAMSFSAKADQSAALAGIDFTPAPGQIISFIGPSGAGRTTTMRIITMLERVVINPGDDGAMIADLSGRRITVYDAVSGRWVDLGEQMRMAGQMGIVPGGGGAAGATGAAAAIAEAQAQAMAGMAQALENAPPGAEAAMRQAIEDAIGISNGGGMPGQLSGGMQQRVGIANGMLHIPEVLILDEPVAGLDVPDARRVQILVDGILQREMGVVVIDTHLGAREAVERMRQMVALYEEITGLPMPQDAVFPDFVALADRGYFPVWVHILADREEYHLQSVEARTIEGHELIGR